MVGRSQINKLIQKEKNRNNLALHLASSSEENISGNDNSSIVDEISVEEFIDNPEYDIHDMNAEIKEWFLKYRPTYECTTCLLEILNKRHSEIPKSVATLIGKQDSVVKRTVTPGTYFHIGVENNLMKIVDVIKTDNIKEIILDIGIDGLPVFLSEVHVLIKTNLSPDTVSSKYLDQFPIQSISELENMETEISADTLDPLINTIKKIVGNDCIKKKLTAIFKPDLLLEFNVEGRQNKKRLLDYPKLMNAIYKSVYRQEMLTKKGFLAEIRKAIRLCKNRNYKDVSIRKRSKNSFLNDDHSNSSSDDENDPPNPNEKVTNTQKNCGRDENKNSCSNEKHITLDFNEF